MSNTTQNTPYTYLIGWLTYDKWYYGVRFSKTCNPEDLWTKYKTSSKYVTRFAADHGDPDIIQVRKTFTSGIHARAWEEKVLRRAKVVLNEKWLNRSNIKAIDPACVPRGVAHWTKNNDDHKLRTSQIMKRPDVLCKVSGSNHYTHKPGWTPENHCMKSPEIREKLRIAVSGDNHYTHRPGYDNSNHYAKRPEAKIRRAELNKIKFTGFKHRQIKCNHCDQEISANNYPQHLRRYHE